MRDHSHLMMLLWKHRDTCKLCSSSLAMSNVIAFDFVYTTYCIGAMKRCLPFALTKEQFYTLATKDCYYCGIQPYRTVRRDGRTFTYNGIDRIDSDYGYHLDNVRPCCQTCNLAKSTLTEQQFYEWVLRVATHLHLTEKMEVES